MDAEALRGEELSAREVDAGTNLSLFLNARWHSLAAALVCLAAALVSLVQSARTIEGSGFALAWFDRGAALALGLAALSLAAHAGFRADRHSAERVARLLAAAALVAGAVLFALAIADSLEHAVAQDPLRCAGTIGMVASLILVALPLLAHHEATGGALQASTLTAGALAWYSLARAPWVVHGSESGGLCQASVFSSLALFSLTYGALWLRPRHGLMQAIVSDTLAGASARRLLPLAILGPLLAAWLRTQGQLRGLFDLHSGVALLATLTMIACVALVWLHTKALDRLSLAREQAAREIALVLDHEASAHRELERVTHRLQLATRAAEIGIWEWDLTTDRIIWDPMMRQLYRREHEPAAENVAEFWSHLDPSDVPRVTQAVTEALRDGRDLDVDFRIRRGDGEKRVMAARALVERDHEGRALRMLGSNIDITEQREAENKLAHSEQVFRSAMEYSAIGMALVGLDGRFTKVNRAVCELLGYPPEELLTKTFQELTYADDLALDLAQAEKLGSGEISHYHMEKRYIRKDGQIVWALLSGSAARDESGRALYYIAQMQDVTQRKQAEAKLRESLAEKDVLLREIHHRVKNNLQIIISMLRLQSHDTDEQQQRVFKECQSRVQTMALIHERLYRAGNLSSVDFGEHLRDLANMLSRAYAEQSARVRLVFDLQPLVLDIDAAISLGLIANEIISNAFTHAFVGRDRGTLSIALSRSGDALRLRMEDDGVGLPPELDIGASKTLGLRLVQALAKQLRAELEIQRAGPTTFTLTLQLRQRE